MTNTSLAQTESNSNLTLLVFLLGLGVLIHKTHLPEPLTSPWPILTTLMAVAALWRPSSKLVASLFALTLIVETLWFWPHVYNHTVFILFVTTAVLASGVTFVSQDVAKQATTIENDLFPTLRAGFYVLFFFAVWHKLNHGYIDPQGSCAIEHYQTLRGRLGILPAAESFLSPQLLIYGTLLLEASIPILLLSRRTRLAGLIVAFGFHYVMGINGHQAFSGLSPAIYVPFLPSALHADVSARAVALRRRMSTKWVPAVLPTVGTALGLLILIAGFTERYYRVRQIGWVTFLVVIPVLFALFLWIGAGSRVWPTTPERGIRRRRILFALLVAALAFNGLNPYFGLKTQAAFSMYSNLRTEAGEWNHLLMPRSMRLVGYQDTLVSVLGVEGLEGRLADLARTGDRAVPLEVKRELRILCTDRNGALPLRLAVDGDTLVFSDGCRQQPLGEPNSILAEKLLWFRPLPLANRCYH